MHTYSYPIPRTPPQRESQVLRTVGGVGLFGAHRLVAAERHQAAITYAERSRLLREAGVQPGGIGASLAALRAALGAMLVRIGAHLRGRPRASGGTSSAVTAG